MKDNQIIVPDISHHNKEKRDPSAIDFSQMYHAGARGLLARSGHGLLEDELFPSIFKRVIDHYMFLLNYWYLYWHLAIVQQIRKYLDTIAKYDLPLSFELDYEEKRRKGDIIHPAIGLREAIKMIYGETGIYPTIYTSPGYYNAYPVNDPIILNCPLHVAHWDVAKPLLPNGFTKAILHQFDVKPEGYDYGIQTLNIDVSIGYEPLEYYYQLAGMYYKDPASMTPENRLARLEAIHTF